MKQGLKKKDPHNSEHAVQVQIFNEFTAFISYLPLADNLKKDAIKVVDCLKFIKVNLDFIAYAVENRNDTSIYTYKKDQAKGLIRDFNNTSMHITAYRTAEQARSALMALVLQFEQAILTMRDRGELETFAYKLEYDKDIGCIEQRTAKALFFAAARISSSDYALDDLMAKCSLDGIDDSNAAFCKVNEFLTPYKGKNCIWKNSDYILNEFLIKQYLSETFGFEYDNFLEIAEIFIGENSIDWETLKKTFQRGSKADCLMLIKNIDPSVLEAGFTAEPNDSGFLRTVFRQQTSKVCLVLIDKLSSSALQKALNKSYYSRFILLEALYSQSPAVCLALFEKINSFIDSPITLLNKYKIIRDNFLNRLNYYYYGVLGFIVSLCSLKYLSTRIIDARILEEYLTYIFTYHSSKVLVYFFARLPLKQQSQIRVRLYLPQIQRRLPYFLLNKELKAEPVEIMDAYYTFIYSYQPLRTKLASDNDPLLANCIDFYFEGKGEFCHAKLRRLFSECLSKKTRLLSRKEKAFLTALKEEEPSAALFIADLAPCVPCEIWEKGVPSWAYYRQLRLHENNPLVHAVLDKLLSVDLVLQGSRAPFSDFFYDSKVSFAVASDYIAAQQAIACIQKTNGLIKIIKPKHWLFFLEQLENLNYRPQLRAVALNSSYKFVHLTGEIVPYQKKRRRKLFYTHTKKTSTTLLSPQLYTSVFGENDADPSRLVGLLFDQAECQVKARLLKDSGTVGHKWLGTRASVESYKVRLAAINQTAADTFTKEVQQRFYHNEVLAKVNKAAICAIVIAKDTPETRRIAIERRDQIKERLFIDTPILFLNSSLQFLRHYTLAEQEDDRRTWAEKQMVCTPREPLSKEKVLAIYEACIGKSEWKLGLLGSCYRLEGNAVPKMVCFCKKVVDKAKQAEQANANSSSYTWAQAEKAIKAELSRKYNQSSFFRLLQGRSHSTHAFYGQLLSY
jgi:hypothetical protein